MDKLLKVNGFIYQESPKIYIAAINGKWLLNHTTPSWRAENPIQGFQRSIQEDRAKSMAITVLDQKRSFPNSIVIATDIDQFEVEQCSLLIPDSIKFLIVDGQHRLWAQHFSDFEANYSCVIHVGLSEIDMAKLFLEINDNQKRVPSSLRWDLVRLVRPMNDPEAVAATEMIYLFATEETSPLFQRIDLTGEQKEIQLKQGSLAPEFKLLLSKRSILQKYSFEQQYSILFQYFIGLRDLDPDQWGTQDSTFYRARVLRALIKLLPEIIKLINKEPIEIKYSDYSPILKKIDETSLAPDAIRAAQGSAGMKALYDLIYAQITRG